MRLGDPKESFDQEIDGAEQEPQSLSLLGGIAKGDQAVGDDGVPLGLEDSPEEDRNLLAQTPILIAIVALVAAGSLYAMRLSQGEMASDKQAQEIEAQMDTWITKATTSNVGVDMTIVDETILPSMDSIDYQVPIKFVKKNPFEFAMMEIESPDLAVGGGSNDAILKKLQAELAKYTVNSIMVSNNRKVALINNEFYQVGDHLGSFVVENMNDMKVLLRYGEQYFTLDIATDTPSARRGR